MANDSDLRCSTVTASLHEPAAGTATISERFVLVELPNPWPKPIAAHPVFASLESPKKRLSENGARVLGIGGQSTTPDRHRVITYVKTLTGGYEGVSTEVSADELFITVLDAVDGAVVGEPVDGTDLLICTQGSHDRCCGRLGTLLYVDVHDRYGDDVRVWRTTHTGGHRFAPTGITLPTGLNWAALDVVLLDTIIEQRSELADVAQHIRGRSAMLNRATQIADVAMMREFGWAWLDRAVSFESTADDAGLNVMVSHGDASATVRLRSGPPFPVPKCGLPLGQARKETPQFTIESIEILR